jgi:hypothetical protein
MIIQSPWAEIKTLLTNNTDWVLYYIHDDGTGPMLPESYTVFTGTPSDIRWTTLNTSTSITDFVNNYKTGATSAASAPEALTKLKTAQPVDTHGKPYSRTESRQVDKTTYFTSRGDDTGVGDGKKICWDFSNTTDDVASPPTNYKQKKIVFKFSDVVQIKDGTIYWMSALKGAYLDLYIYHPVLQQNLQHYVIEHPLMDDCPMGDELNTEASSEEIPAGTEFHLFVTVPDSTGYDNFYGHVSIEANRAATV